jgi:metal-responsive CopG/Arc/MetJ family transcriptional regulator
MEDKRNPMATLQVRLPEALLERLDQYRARLQIEPTRSQALRFLIENALNSQEEHAPATPRREAR